MIDLPKGLSFKIWEIEILDAVEHLRKKLSRYIFWNNGKQNVNCPYVHMYVVGKIWNCKAHYGIAKAVQL